MGANAYNDAVAFGGEASDRPATAEELAVLEFEPLPAEDTAPMYRNFSEEPWADECRDHGVALRCALMLLMQTKEKLVDATERMEKEFFDSGPGPTAELMASLEAHASGSSR
jgi:hypothetical protein